VPPTGVHFNGSVNLPDAETVMREISARIPRGVRRMTDGETGDRNYWIHYQIRKFREMPEFEAVPMGRIYETEDDAPEMFQIRLREGATVDAIEWPTLGYADEYGKSFAIFDRLQEEGTIPAGVRFQMQYPTPLASTGATFAPEDLPAIGASYEQALFADLAKALANMPHDRVAVQWDIAMEFGLLEGAMGMPRVPVEQIATGIVRAVDQVPADVPVGLHLCYGDYGHKHFVEPESLQMQVDLLNAVVATASRPLDFVSFTVPQGRGDAEYFAPLAALQAPDTELNLALVPYHPDRQAEGTTATQIGHVDALLDGREWGICTECGMGRAAADDVPALLDLHRTILAPAAAAR
jgi:hypothetical protein